jgi:hypothetical protein
MGSGLYASKLPHDDWVRFNNAQRVHYNYLEGIALVLVVEVRPPPASLSSPPLHAAMT